MLTTTPIVIMVHNQNEMLHDDARQQSPMLPTTIML